MKPRHDMQGFVMSEYLVVCLVLVAILFVPVPGLGLSLVELVLEALAAHKANSLHLLSMP